jgi:thymidylate kinase
VRVALEGPANAGKTTAALALAAMIDASYLPCYASGLSKGTCPPAHTRTAAEQHAATRMFLTVEAERVRKAATAPARVLVLLDRSVDSLLAHAFALDARFGLGAFPGVRCLVNSAEKIVPDLTFLLAPPPVDLADRPHRDLPRLLRDPDFNREFLRFFSCGPLVTRKLVRVPPGDVDGHVRFISDEIGGGVA